MAERPDADQAKPTHKAVMARVPRPAGGVCVVERGGVPVDYQWSTT